MRGGQVATLPHNNVLGGVTRQRVTYYQLSLTQFIQVFAGNIIAEPDKTKGRMLW